MIEFVNGQKVTFKPYEKAFPALIQRSYMGSAGKGMTVHGEDDDRVFYVLVNPDNLNMVISHTTGTSIVESTLYEPEETGEKHVNTY